MFDETNGTNEANEVNGTNGTNEANEVNSTNEVNNTNGVNEAKPEAAMGGTDETVVNPYMAQAQPQPEPEKEKKSTNKVIIGVVAGAAVLLVLVLVLVFSGVFADNKKTVLKALGKNFAESGEYMEAAYDLKQYEGMFEDDAYTFDADIDTAYYGVGVDMKVEKNEDACSTYASVGISGSTILDAQVYVDDDAVVVGLPQMIDYLLTINRATMAEDIQNMVEIGMLDQETADSLVAINEGMEEETVSEEASQKMAEEFAGILKELYDKCEMKKGSSKKLPVNGKEVSCKGYVLTIENNDVSDFIDDLKEVYQNNEESLMAYNSMYEYSDMDIRDALDEFYSELDRAAEELRDSEEEPLQVEFYLYKGYVAQIYAEGEDDQYIEWNMEGGNFPMENTSFVLADEYGEQLRFERTGSDKDDKYQASYEVTVSYEDPVILDFTYKKNRGDFSLEVLSDDQSMFYLEGNIDKKDDTTLEVDIDSLEIGEESILSGKLTFENTCDDIERPEGEERELLLMSEDELYEVSMDIIISLY